MLRLLAMICLGTPFAMSPSPGLDEIPDDPGRWIEADPPRHHTEAWLAANHDDHEWVVTLRDDRPRAHLRDAKAEAPAPLPFEVDGGAREGLYGRRSSIEVADGWIVGFDAGEFGCGLWWFSPDGKDRLKLADAHVKRFLPTDSGLLTVEGLAHLSLDRGRILRISLDPKGRWRAEDFLDLKAAPQVAAKLADGRLLIATNDRLLKIDPATKGVEVLLDKAFWGGLYPNSMALTSTGVIYVGMRHGVAKVEKKGDAYQVRWLLPNRTFVEMKPKYR